MLPEIAQIPDPIYAYFGRVIYEPGGEHGPRLQPNVQLVLLLDGRADIQVDGKVHALESGWVSCMHPGRHEHYRFARGQRTEHSWVSMNWGPAAPAPVLALLDALEFSTPLARPLREMVDHGVALQAQPGVGRQAMLCKLASACLLAFTEQCRPEAFTGDAAAFRRKPAALLQAMSYANSHIDHPLSLAALADHAETSATHLVRLFRTHVGMTPMRWLWRERVRRGIELLRETGLSSMEISLRLGFASPHHFSRLVRAAAGISPRDLRARAWASTEP